MKQKSKIEKFSLDHQCSVSIEITNGVCTVYISDNKDIYREGVTKDNLQESIEAAVTNFLNNQAEKALRRRD